jgi:uncharacterized protein YcfJ
MKNVFTKNISALTKKLSVTASLATLSLLLANTAQAQTMLVKVLQASDEIVSQVYKEVPIKSCRIEKTPIYGTQEGSGQASTADVVASAIFGGLLGNQVGGGTGKDAATLLGAIAGADMANKKGKSKQVIVGHNQQEVCDVIMQQRSVNQVTGYKTYIEFGGNVWQMTTVIPYTKGEFLSVNVNITPAE